jgi:hypothetical protein
MLTLLPRRWETPSQFNQRIGLNSTVIQISQTIPLMPYNYVTGVLDLHTPCQCLANRLLSQALEGWPQSTLSKRAGQTQLYSSRYIPCLAYTTSPKTTIQP